MHPRRDVDQCRGVSVAIATKVAQTHGVAAQGYRNFHTRGNLRSGLWEVDLSAAFIATYGLVRGCLFGEEEYIH